MPRFIYLLLPIALLISISSCKDDEPSKTNILGHAILPDSCAQRNFTYILVPLQGEYQNVYGSGIIDSGGSFTINQVFVENYDIYLKPSGMLQKKFSDIEVSEYQNSIDFGPFIPGDLNGDNVVNFNDYGTFTDAYGSAVSDPEYDFLSDFNCDGIIDTADFFSFSEAYNENGDEP